MAGCFPWVAAEQVELVAAAEQVELVAAAEQVELVAAAERVELVAAEEFGPGASPSPRCAGVKPGGGPVQRGAGGLGREAENQRSRRGGLCPALRTQILAPAPRVFLQAVAQPAVQQLHLEMGSDEPGGRASADAA